MSECRKNPWLQVAVSGAVVLTLLGLMGRRVIKDHLINRELRRTSAPAAWAAQPTTNWPNLVMAQEARFKNHTPMAAGCASLVRLPSGELVALTAGHLLGPAGGVKPGFNRGGLGGLDQKKLATLDEQIVSWRLFVPERESAEVHAIGLFGEAEKFDRDSDQILLRLASTNQPMPVAPLAIRLDPVTFGEPLWVVGFTIEDDEARQAVFTARRIQGIGFTCLLDRPTDLNGFSGAPVVDKEGRVVAIVTGGTLMDAMNQSDKATSFSGHEVSELMPVLKAAIRK